MNRSQQLLGLYIPLLGLHFCLYWHWIVAFTEIIYFPLLGLYICLYWDCTLTFIGIVYLPLLRLYISLYWERVFNFIGIQSHFLFLSKILAFVGIVHEELVKELVL